MPNPLTILASLPWLPVLAAAIASWLFGALWYGLLGKTWLEALGKSAADLSGPDGRTSPVPFVLSFVLQVVMAAMLYGVLFHIGGADIRRGVISAVLVWTGFVLTVLWTNHAYTRASPRLTLIDGAHWLGALVIQGAVLGAFVVR